MQAQCHQPSVLFLDVSRQDELLKPAECILSVYFGEDSVVTPIFILLTRFIYSTNFIFGLQDPTLLYTSNLSNDGTYDALPKCRICYSSQEDEETKDVPLVSPCACPSAVHEHCLNVSA